MNRRTLFILLIILILNVFFILSFTFYEEIILFCENKASDAIKTSVKKEIPEDVNLLNNIFRDELKDRGISAQTAVIYTDKNSVAQKSRPDNAFFESSRLKVEVMTGVADEISVQGFVRLTPLVIFLQYPWEWALLALGLIIAVLICIFGFIRFRETKPIPPAEKIKLEPDPLQEKIVLNCTTNVLICDGKELELPVQMCMCLKLLGEASGYYLGYQEFSKAMYGEKLDKMNYRLHQLVTRMRHNILNQTPNLEILNVRGKGYRLKINDRYILTIEK